ncbi:glutathione S-transferase [uncultured Rhodoblastus sp.]|uniref:glutathione S-transferase family protein n=1 Tax=uncultured Rhodoblastus sp. TaxID=543037 RepID=UPI0025F4BA2E|nr:glutathione S-transferase [uncultured Rhodoblastus sp.]
MKLYDSAFAPNPRRVRMFLAEKGIAVPMQAVDLASLQQKAPEFSAVNPLQRIPALALDSGEVLTESVAICRYFEELQPAPPLFGESALEKARVEMWQRRAELEFFLPIAQAFRHSHPAMREMEKPQIAELAQTSRPRAVAFARFLDAELSQRPYLAGETFTIADITAFVAAEFARFARITFPDELVHLARWRAGIAARPSAAA